MDKKHLMTALFILICMAISTSQISAQLLNDKLGVLENNGDVGKVEIPGTSVCDPEIQEYTLQGSGKNIWFGEDEFQFLYKKLRGDFILTAQVKFVGISE